MSWQRVARVAVAVIGIGTAVAVYVLTRPRTTTRQAGVGTADPTTTIESGRGMTFRYKDGDRQFTLEYGSIRQHADGQSEWTAFHLLTTDGTDLRGDIAESVGHASSSNDPPKELNLKGHVSLRTQEGLTVTAENVHWVDATGQATVPGATAFTRERMSGTGTGAIYERDTGTFRLLADAHMTVAPAPGDQGGQIEATAHTMTFNRAGNALLFDEDAHIVHGTDTMSADRATLYLTPDHEQFRVIELRGHSRVTPAPGQEQTAPPDMQADDIDLAFYDGTQVLQRAVLNRQASMTMIDANGRRVITAATIMLTTAPDGRTLTHLEGTDRVTVKTPAQNGTPERTITAPSLVATGDEKIGLTLAQFTGGARFVETVPAAGGQAASSRTGTSQTLALKLNGQFDAIDEAQFQQNVRFEDGTMVGDADVGVYLASKAQLTLKPFDRNAKRQPRVTDGSVTVDAGELIDVDLNTDDLHARRDVKTVTAGQKDASAQSQTGLFDAEDPVYGQSAEFWYTGASKRTRYLGTPAARARVQQTGSSNSSVTAIEVTVVDQRNLIAKGTVEAVFLLTDQHASPAASGAGAATRPSAPAKPATAGTAPGAAGTPTRYRVTADTLDYDDDARTAVYTGAPVTMTSDDGTTTSQRLVLKLAAEQRSLDRLDATVDVHTKLTNGRDAIADVLIYESAIDRYTLRGARGVPIVMREQADKPGTCSVVKALVGYFTHSDAAPVFPEAENPGSVERRDKSGADCTGELKR